MKVEWSAAALADLDRFAAFLADKHPSLSAVVGREIIAKAQVLAAHPRLGFPIRGRPEYRQLVLQVLRASYVSSCCACSMRARVGSDGWTART
jgi:plasmid stabilization system protein ParE